MKLDNLPWWVALAAVGWMTLETWRGRRAFEQRPPQPKAYPIIVTTGIRG